ncbi:MAG: rod shape-determining protein MreC [Leeuwenhoekiella sp.]
MQQIINILVKYRNFLLFLVLLLLSLFFTIQSHSYHRSKFVNSANFLSGGIYTSLSDVSDYFDLKTHNAQLVEENRNLRQQLFNRLDTVYVKKDSAAFDGTYQFFKARVINNNYALRDNFITLRAGKRDSVIKDLGVITSKGIIGVIDQVSTKFSTVVSILNSNSQINAKLKKSGHFGILEWDGKDPNIVNLVDVQEKAPVAKGDTIVTGGMSTIFPEGIGIGTVSDFQLDASQNYYTIHIKLFNDMTNIGHVYIIKNMDRKEIETLEEQAGDEQ